MYRIMSKMIKIVSLLEHHLPQDTQPAVLFFFNAHSVHLKSVTSQDIGKQLF